MEEATVPKGYEVVSTEHLVSLERQAKGDLEVLYNSKGKIARAIPINLTIARELVRRGIFPQHFVIFGDGFLELREAFRSPYGVKSGAVLLEQWGKGVSLGIASGIYENVCRGMGNRRIAIVEYVMEQQKEYEKKEEHSLYKDCFDLLCQLMDKEREKAKELFFGK